MECDYPNVNTDPREEPKSKSFSRKEMRAYCDSQACTYKKQTTKNKSNGLSLGEPKDVPYPTTFCPNCKCALIWLNPRQTWNKIIRVQRPGPVQKRYSLYDKQTVIS